MCGAAGQLYHVYPAQVVLCVDLGRINVSLNGDAYVAPAKLTRTEAEEAAAAPTASATPYAEIHNVSHALAVNNAAATLGATPKPASGGSSASGNGGTSGSSPPPQLSQVLTLNRTSALVEKEQCNVDEVVVHAQSEDSLAATTATFIHVEWRSPSDIIDYLGALARSSGGTGSENIFSVHDKSDPAQGVNLGFDYRGRTYYVYGESLRALRVVNELVNLSKLTSASQISQPILFVP